MARSSLHVPAKSFFSVNVGFSYLQPQYSDCTLHQPSGGSDVETKSTDEIPCASLVLAAKSAYFQTLFDGSFMEAASKRVDLSISDADWKTFQDLVYFMYHGAVKSPGDLSFTYLTQLLILADRFQVDDCIVYCLNVLSCNMDELSIADALSIISLPDSIQRMPEALEIVQKAHSTFLDGLPPLIANAKDEAFFLTLPVPGLLFVLDADDLDIISEDTLLDAACHWINANFKEKTEKLASMANHVLPRIRLQFLTPSGVERLLEWLTRNEGVLNQNHLFGAIAKGMNGEKRWTASEEFLSSVKLGIVISLLLNSACLAQNLVRKFIPSESRTVVPRCGYRGPDEEIHLDLPYGTSVPHPSMAAASTSFTISGRSFIFARSMDRNLSMSLLTSVVKSADISSMKFAFKIQERSLGVCKYRTLHSSSWIELGEKMQVWVLPPSQEWIADSLQQAQSQFFPHGVVKLKLEIWVKKSPIVLMMNMQ